VKIHSPSLKFEVEAFDNHGILETAGEFETFLLSSDLTHTIGLYPWLIDFDEQAHLDEEERVEGFFEPMYLYHGRARKIVTYLGSKKKPRREKINEKIREALQKKDISQLVLKSNQITPWTLAEYARETTYENIGRLIGSKYLPESYFTRREMDVWLNDFLLSNKSGFLIVGEAGVGKSSLLCRKAEEWLGKYDENITREDIVLFFSARDVRTSSGTPDIVFRHIRSQLGISDTVTKFTELLRYLDSKRDADENQDRRFILIIDSVNESDNMRSIIQEIDDIIHCLEEHTWFKVIFSVRRINYSIMKRKRNELGKPSLLQDTERYYTIESQDPLKERTLEIPLAVLTEEEVEFAFNIYQSASKEYGNIPATKSSYSSLSSSIKNLVQNPLMLKLLMITYNEIDVPENADELSILDSYHTHISENASLQELVQKIVNRMLLVRKPLLYGGDCEDFLNAWRRGKTPEDILIFLDPIEQLQDLGVILAQPLEDDQKYFFTHQRYLEFLLSRELKRNHSEITGNTIIELLDLDVNDEEFPEYYSAIEILLTEMAQAKKYNEVAYSINKCNYRINEIGSRVLYSLEMGDMISYKSSVETSQNTNSAHLIEAIFNDFSINSKIVLMEFVKMIYPAGGVRRSQEVLERLSMDKSVMEEKGDSAEIFGLMGHLYFNIGDHEKAILHMNQALQIAEDLEENDKISSILNNISCIYTTRGEYDRALKTFQRALNIEQELGNNSEIATRLNNIGHIYHQIAEFENAMLNYQKALKISEELEDRSNMALSLNNIGMVFKAQGEYEYAMQNFGKALTISTELGDKRSMIVCFVNAGSIHSSQGNYNLALQNFQNALGMAEELGDKAKISITLTNLGSVYKARAEYEFAMVNFKKALSVSTDLRDKQGIASSLASIGGIFQAQGDYRTAMQNFHLALTKYEELQDRSGIAHCLIHIGGISEAQGDYESAMQNYKKALHMEEEIGAKGGIQSCSHNIGSIYHAQGDYEKALRNYKRALHIAQEIGDRSAIAGCMNNIAGIYVAQGDDELALQNLQKALRIAEELGDRSGMAMRLNNIGGIYNDRGQSRKALKHYQKALLIAEELGEKHESANFMNNIASIYHVRGDFVRALQNYQEALRIAKELGDRNGMAMRLHNIGGIYNDRGEFDLALQYCSQALSIAEELGEKPVIANFLFTIGGIYYEKEDSRNALKYLERCISIRDSLGIPTDDIVEIISNMFQRNRMANTKMH